MGVWVTGGVVSNGGCAALIHPTLININLIITGRVSASAPAMQTSRIVTPQDG